MVIKRSKNGTADPMGVVSRFLDAANHHDADALRACVHHDFESIQPVHPARNFRGSGQLISNWKAIFEAEPGFRLTVLRSAVADDTVWVEVHGAGDSAEAAGIFIVGVEDGRIRWIRVYSDLVEPAPELAPEVEPAAEAAQELEAAAAADGEAGQDETEEAAGAVDDQVDAVGRPLRLVEPAEAELEEEEGDDPGAATALRLVGDEAGADDDDGAAAGLEGVEAGELLDVPADEEDTDAAVDDDVVEVAETEPGVDATETGDGVDATETGEEGDALVETVEGTADDGAETGTVDDTVEPADAEIADGVEELIDLTTDDETSEADDAEPATEDAVDVTPADETVEGDESDQIDAAAEDASDVTPPGLTSEVDDSDTSAGAEAVVPDEEDGSGAEEPAGQQGAGGEEDGAGTEPVAGGADRTGPQLSEPTSPPLPRVGARGPVAEEEKPPLRRKWRWMRGGFSRG